MKIDANKQSLFKKTYHIKKRYLYTPSTLEYLINKSSLFLLDYFRQLFQHINTTAKNTTVTTNGNKKQGKKKRSRSKYKLTILNEDVDITCLPTGYSTRVPPLPELCDDCYKILDNDSSGTVLICGHGYYWHCYGQMEYGCRHCEQYYKDGIYKNVNSFLQRLEKGADIISENDGIEEELQDLDEELEEDSEHENIQEKDINLQSVIEDIDKW